ncbi:helix-turn-helix transcriptional regulator [Clostridium sp. KNHs216]|uniref:helix-turn-helix domain-containing protein n=1 Tax=Clostridium sp. KNHs216 TaxID=1550235 RepID=UPI0011525282|nr:helix-turn-helix transcriptional regulator [Clostridium sp. KNHs216]TQI66759.1 helix-turn-helix protein [Clostridium sp. KNHs216]
MIIKNESQEAFNSLFSELSEVDIKKHDLKHKIASKILKLRTERGFGQSELAQFMEVSQSLVAKWESGKCNFTIDTLVDIFDRFDVELDLLLTDKATENYYNCDAMNTESAYQKYTTGYAFANSQLAYAG